MELVADINLVVLALPQSGHVNAAFCSTTRTSPVRPQSLQAISYIGMIQPPPSDFFRLMKVSVDPLRSGFRPGWVKRSDAIHET
jgi:hypothetical protein